MSFDPVSYALGARAGGLRPTSLYANENRTYTPEAGECFTEVEVDVENENGVVPLSGTLALPWGEAAYFAPLREMLAEGSVSAMLRLSAGGTTATLPLMTEEGVLHASAARYQSGEVCDAAQLVWSAQGLVQALVTLEGVTSDLAAEAEQIPVTLTLFYHPMPGGEEEPDGE